MSAPGAIPPIFALPHVSPEFFAGLTPAEKLVLPYIASLWLRPDQVFPRHHWRYYGKRGGRGWGKSLAISTQINGLVRSGAVRALALMAPTDKRVTEVQVNFLISTAPPWFQPKLHNEVLEWPNGATAQLFTPEAPGRSRSGNFELTWVTEIVDWQANTRREAFDNLATATRVGRAQLVWDTTSQGKNNVIQMLESLHASDPKMYPIQRGTMFDNPLLSRAYLRDTCLRYTGRRYEEEVEGKSFAEAEGALWEQDWLDDHRVFLPPDNPELTVLAVDPGLSDHKSADPTGIVLGSRIRSGDVYVLADLSLRAKPEQWGDVVIEAAITHRAAGVIVERNHLGDNATYVLSSRAAAKGLTTRVLRAQDAFPRWSPGVLYVRETVSRSNKSTRAEGPASETQLGHVHMVGQLSELEEELTTWEPGDRKSPNRLDAFAALVNELRGLGHNHGRDRRSLATAVKATHSLHEKMARAAPRRIGL